MDVVRSILQRVVDLSEETSDGEKVVSLNPAQVYEGSFLLHRFESREGLTRTTSVVVKWDSCSTCRNSSNYM